MTTNRVKIPKIRTLEPKPGHPGEYQEPADIQNQIAEKIKENKSHRSQVANPFPIQAFHPMLQDFCESHHRCYGYPLDWYGAGIMAIPGTVIGNAFAAEYRPNWYSSPLFWIALVGRSSSGKTQVMKKHTEPPIKALQNQMMLDFEAEQIMDGEKDEKKDLNPLEQPMPQRLLLNKFSLEQAVVIMLKNRRSLLISRSELIAFFQAMGQYKSKGNDEEKTWLEFWDNDDILLDMVKYGNIPVFLRRTNVSVWGGVQDDLLHEFANNNKAESGAFGRFLFSYADEMNKPYPATMNPSKDCIEKYDRLINTLHSYPNLIPKRGHVKSVMIPFDEKAREIYYNYLKSSTDQQNAADNNLERSILGKLETYTLRFACLLKMLDWACEGRPLKAEDYREENNRWVHPELHIGEEVITRALFLKDYFLATSRKVTNRIESPVNKLPPDQQDWYRALPFDEPFKTKTALSSAEAAGIAKRTAELSLSDPVLFKKIKTGWYERRHF